MFKMRHFKKMKNMIRGLLSLAIIFSLSFPASIFAAEITLRESIDLKGDSMAGLTTLTVLPKGTVLEMDDKYIIQNNDGTINEDMTLRNWINGSRLKETGYNENGVIKKDIFFNVKILKNPNGDYVGHRGFVALKSLALRDGLEIETIEPTPIVQTQEQQRTPPSNTNYSEQQTAGEAKVCLGDCRENNSFFAKLKKDMSSIMESVRNKTNKAMRGKRPDSSFQAVVNNFEKNCFGLKFDDFVQVVRQRASAQNIPPELMLGIATQETGGYCHGRGATGDVTSTSKSLGLFQVNTRSSRVPPCSSSQISKLHGKTLAQMSSDSSLRCLQNPAVSLDEGIKIYLQKFNYVNNGAQPKKSAGTFSQLPQTEADKHRKALAAYNGGESWVELAKKDMNANQSLHGRSTDNWEDLRYFWARRVLKNNGYAVSSSYSGNGRSIGNAISNLAYVESILGRSSGSNTQRGYVHHWESLIARPTNLVASRSN